MLTASGALAKSVPTRPVPVPLPRDQRAADNAAENYVDLLAEVHSDYVNGHVVVHDGWVLSEHEFATIEIRRAENATAATAG